MIEPRSGSSDSSDPYARSDYRRLIAWDARIRREGPFLAGLLAKAPERSVLDIGCGSGEHVAYFARLGARAVGLDRSEAMLEQAKDHEARGEGRFVRGDGARAREVLGGEPSFGLAICLGNTLPHFLEDADLEALLSELRSVLLPRGLLLLQVLNYRRILDQGIRHLPLNFREGDGGEEIVFLRLLAQRARRPERMLFFPTTLALDPTSEEPVRVVRTRRVELRPWTASDIVPRLERLGFEVELHGDMEGGAFHEAESMDLVVVARRRSPEA